MLRSCTLGALVMALLAAAACSSAGAAPGDNPGEAGGSDATSAGGTTGDGGTTGEEGGAAGAAGSIIVSGGSGGQPPITGCQTSSIPGNRVPASVLVVLDKSASMQDGNKWTGAVLALKTMLDEADPELRMGFLRYPEATTSPCKNPLDIVCQTNYDCTDIKSPPNVLVAPLKLSGGQIGQVLSSTAPDGNSTPTYPALKAAYAYMAGIEADGDRYVLLVTDGEPTYKTPPIPGLTTEDMGVACGVEADLAKAPTDARKANPSVRTFVVGAPGSEKASLVLSGIANNGGTCRPGGNAKDQTCHYQIGSSNFEQDLAKVLTDIAGTVSDCVYAVPKANGQEVDPTKVNVTVDTGDGGGSDDYVPQDAKNEDGWNYTDDSKSKIQIFGAQCEAIKASLSSKVNIVLGCATVVKPVG